MNATMLLVLAWRNVWRNPLRSLILIASVVVGLWAGLFVVAFYQGMNEQRLRGGIEEVGHIQVHARGFRDEPRADRVLPGGDSVERVVRALPGMASTARSVVRGMLATARATAGGEIRGVDPAAEDAVSGLGGKIREGAFFGDGFRHPVVVGERLAAKRGLKPGAKLVLTFQDSAGDMVSGAFRVAGLFRTSDARFDDAVVYVPRGQLDALAGLGPSSAHEIAVRLRRPSDLDTAVERLRERLPGLEVLTWKQVSPDLALSESSFAQIMLVFLAIVMLGLAFGIVNTMLMAVLDRTREIGTLMALGLRRGRVFQMILAETVVLVLAGAPLGLGLAVLSIEWTGRRGIDLSRIGEGLGQFGMASRVFPALPPGAIGEVLGLVAATAVLASLLPARKALSLHPTEAIRST